MKRVGIILMSQGCIFTLSHCNTGIGAWFIRIPQIFQITSAWVSLPTGRIGDGSPPFLYLLILND